MCVAHTGMDILFHDTFYVIGHFHVMFAGGAMFGAFGAFYFYFPAIFGVKYSRLYSYLHYSYYLIGQLLTVIRCFDWDTLECLDVFWIILRQWVDGIV